MMNLDFNLTALKNMAEDFHDLESMTHKRRAEVVRMIVAHANAVDSRDWVALPKLLDTLKNSGNPIYTPFIETMERMQVNGGEMKKDAQITFRATAEQAASLRAAADEDGRSLGGYLLMLHRVQEERIKRGEK